MFPFEAARACDIEGKKFRSISTISLQRGPRGRGTARHGKVPYLSSLISVITPRADPRHFAAILNDHLQSLYCPSELSTVGNLC